MGDHVGVVDAGDTVGTLAPDFPAPHRHLIRID
jgi:hypothetical protein